MNARKFGLLLVLVIAALAIWLFARPKEYAPAPQTSSSQLPAGSTLAPPPSSRPGGIPPPPSEVHAGAGVHPAPPMASDVRAPAAPVGDAAPAPPAEPASAGVTSDLEQVQTALRSFRTALGGNPVGTNEEITRALLGDNLKQVKVPVPPGSRVNAAGELTDRWGTPYFFHQLSGTQMEVRSAGPDRILWNADDAELK